MLDNSFDDNQKCLFIATSDSDVDLIADLLKTNIKNYLIIASTAGACEKLYKLKLPFLETDNYFPLDLTLKLFKKGQKLARTWYLSKIVKNRLDYQGINLASNIELVFHHYLSEVLRSSAIAKSILEKERPAKIIVSDRFIQPPNLRWHWSNFNLDNKLLIFWARRRGIKVELINRPNSNLPSIDYMGSFASTILGQLIFLIKSQFSQELKINQKKSTILAFGDYYQLTNMIPVIKKINNNQDYNLLVTGRTSDKDKKLINNFSFNFCPIEELVPRILPLQFLFFKLKFWKLWRKIKNDINLQSQFKGIYKEPFWEFVAPKLEMIFRVECPLISSYINIARQLVNSISPKAAVFMATADTFNHAIARTFAKLGVKTILIQHGLEGGLEIPYLFADKIAVWGEEVKNLYIKNGIKRNKIAITGFPVFDKYKNARFRQRKSRVRKQFTITVLLVSPSGIGKLFTNYSQQREIGTIVKSVRSLGVKPKVFVRSHPSDDINLIGLISKRFKKEFNIANKIKLSDLLYKSDLVITQPTTPLIEAMILKKPVIFCFPVKALGAVNFFGKCELSAPAKRDDLSSLIAKIINNSKKRQELVRCQTKLLKDYISKVDGKSSERIAKLVFSMISA